MLIVCLDNSERVRTQGEVSEFDNKAQSIIGEQSEDNQFTRTDQEEVLAILDSSGVHHVQLNQHQLKSATCNSNSFKDLSGQFLDDLEESLTEENSPRLLQSSQPFEEQQCDISSGLSCEFQAVLTDTHNIADNSLPVSSANVSRPAITVDSDSSSITVAPNIQPVTAVPIENLSESSSESFYSPPESITSETDNLHFSDTFNEIEREIDLLVSEVNCTEEDTVSDTEKETSPIIEEDLVSKLSCSEEEPLKSVKETSPIIKDFVSKPSYTTEELLKYEKETTPIIEKDLVSKLSCTEKELLKNTTEMENSSIIEEICESKSQSSSPHPKEIEIVNMEELNSMSVSYIIERKASNDSKPQYTVSVSSDKDARDATNTCSLASFLQLHSELQTILSDSNSVDTLTDLTFTDSKSVTDAGGKNLQNGLPSRPEIVLGTFLNQVAGNPLLQNEPKFVDFVGGLVPVANGCTKAPGHDTGSDVSNGVDHQAQNGKEDGG